MRLLNAFNLNVKWKGRRRTFGRLQKALHLLMVDFPNSNSVDPTKPINKRRKHHFSHGKSVTVRSNGARMRERAGREKRWGEVEIGLRS